MADPEGPLPGGVTKSARSAAGGGCGRGIPPPTGGGPGGLPRENFWKMDANGAFLAHFFAEFVSIFSQKIVCNFCLQSSDDAQRENVYLSCRGSYKAKKGTVYPLVVGEGGSGSPRENVWKTDANCAFWAHFCRVRVDFFPKNCVYFCLQSSDLRYTWCGRIFTFAVEDHIKPKRGIFYLLAVGVGGGCRGLPEKIFEKRQEMVLAHFCRLPVDLFPKNCV